MELMKTNKVVDFLERQIQQMKARIEEFETVHMKRMQYDVNTMKEQTLEKCDKI